MITQLDLFEKSLLEEFESWLSTAEGSTVADEFTATAVALHAGGQREGARAIWEHLRWTTRRRLGGDEGAYRFNDHHVPYLARRAVQIHPELSGFFEFRERAPSRRPSSAVVIPIQRRGVA